MQALVGVERSMPSLVFKAIASSVAGVYLAIFSYPIEAQIAVPRTKVALARTTTDETVTVVLVLARPGVEAVATIRSSEVVKGEATVDITICPPSSLTISQELVSHVGDLENFDDITPTIGHATRGDVLSQVSAGDGVTLLFVLKEEVPKLFRLAHMVQDREIFARSDNVPLDHKVAEQNAGSPSGNILDVFPIADEAGSVESLVSIAIKLAIIATETLSQLTILAITKVAKQEPIKGSLPEVPAIVTPEHFPDKGYLVLGYDVAKQKGNIEGKDTDKKLFRSLDRERGSFAGLHTELPAKIKGEIKLYYIHFFEHTSS